MAKRFHSLTGKTTKDLNEYDLEIWDEDFVGSSTEFTQGGDIFNLHWSGEIRKKPMYLQPSELTFSMVIDTSTLRTFVDDLSGAHKGRFKIKVFRNSNFYWCGNLVIGDTHHPDLETHMIEIRATDMIGSLKEIDFNDDGTAYSDTDTFILFIQKCLSKTGLLDFGWGASDVCFKTADNVYEDSMSTGATNDPLALARSKHNAFFEIDNQGQYKYKSTYEVLEQVLQHKHLNLKFSNGSFRIYQYKEIAASTLTHERRYDRDGAYLSSASAVDITKTLDQDDLTAAKEDIVDFGWYSPYRRVEITYHAKNWHNYAAGTSWSDTSASLFTGDEIKKSGTNTKVAVTVSVAATLDNSSYTDGDDVFLLFRLTVKVGSKYLKRDYLGTSNYQVSYGNVEWSSTTNYYYFHYGVYGPQIPGTGSSATVVNAVHDFVTPPITEDGDFEMYATLTNIIKLSDGNDIPIGGQLDSEWTVSGTEVRVYTSGNPQLDMADFFHVATNDNADDTSEKIELKSYIGDGTNTNSQGKIEVYNGSTWEDSADWQIGGTGTKLSVLSLVAKQSIAMRKTTVRRLSGDIYDTAGTMQAHSRIDDNSSDAVWMFVQGTYNARLERWSGEWIYIADSPADITALTPGPIVPIRDPRATQIGDGGGLVPTGPIRHTTIEGTGTISNTVDGLISLGDTVTTINVGETLKENAYVQDQVITLFNPVNNYSQNFTVSADVSDSDTSISVTSDTAEDDFPPGSFIVVSPMNDTVKNFGASPGGGGGVSDHGALTGLTDDDHTQYHNDTRGDARYYTQTQLDAGQLDNQYYQESEFISASTGSGSADEPIKTDSNGKLANSFLYTIDHGGLNGLNDDDHPNYHNDTRGDARYYTQTQLDAGQLDNQYYQESEFISASTGSGSADEPIKTDSNGKLANSFLYTIDHGGLNGLNDDDHPNYHNDTRGDARYYTQTQLDAGQLDNQYYQESEFISASTGSGSADEPIKTDSNGKLANSFLYTIDHGGLNGLNDDDHPNYHNDTRGDARYYTQTQLDAGQLDSRYYTETELDAGQLDNRYFTESEHINSSAGAGDAGKPIKLNASGKVDSSMLDTTSDHGSLTGLTDDDHTQYVKNTGRSGGQTIQGGTASGEDLELESTANATKGDIIFKDDVIGEAGFDFRSDQNAGNGSTAGLTIKDTDGIRLFASSSATPRIDLVPSSGLFAIRSRPTVGDGSANSAGVVFTHNGIYVYPASSSSPDLSFDNNGRVLFDAASHPGSISTGEFYIKDGIIYTDADGGSNVQPNFGHIKKFNVFNYSTAWTTGVVDGEFWSVTQDYAGFEIWKIGWGSGNSQGTGSGSNIVQIIHDRGGSTTTINNATINTGGSSSGTDSTLSNVVSLATNDIIYFDCTQVSATTAAEGLMIDFYLRKT